MPKTIGPALVLWLLLTLTSLPAAAWSLSEVESDVRSDYPTVEHITPSKIGQTEDRSDLLIFDVREKPEFTVSHISGAIQVDPNLGARSFLKRYGELAAGKKVIFYCSVGVRSSEMAVRFQSALKAAGSRSVANLSGGIFRWHNEQRLLKNSNGPTDAVHPYNSNWGKLLTRQSKISYQAVGR